MITYFDQTCWIKQKWVSLTQTQILRVTTATDENHMYNECKLEEVQLEACCLFIYVCVYTATNSKKRVYIHLDHFTWTIQWLSLCASRVNKKKKTLYDEVTTLPPMNLFQIFHTATTIPNARKMSSLMPSGGSSSA
jgi:hypothetical protein